MLTYSVYTLLDVFKDFVREKTGSVWINLICRQLLYSVLKWDCGTSECINIMYHYKPKTHS